MLMRSDHRLSGFHDRDRGAALDVGVMLMPARAGSFELKLVLARRFDPCEIALVLGVPPGNGIGVGTSESSRFEVSSRLFVAG
jgi:hypothetical protein